VQARYDIIAAEPYVRLLTRGAIGYIAYDGNMDINIAVRTLVHSHGMALFRAGGRIVADSERDAGYQETFDKAAALLSLQQQRAESVSGNA